MFPREEGSSWLSEKGGIPPLWTGNAVLCFNKPDSLLAYVVAGGYAKSLKMISK